MGRGGVHLLVEGRAEKEGEGVTSDMLFPSSGIYLSTQYAGQAAGRRDPKMYRAKGIYVQHLSVRPPCWMQCQELGSSPMGTSIQEQLQGPGKMGFPASSPA